MLATYYAIVQRVNGNQSRSMLKYCFHSATGATGGDWCLRNCYDQRDSCESDGLDIPCTSRNRDQLFFCGAH